MEYMRHWQGHDTNQIYRLEHWRDEIGKYKLIDLTPRRYYGRNSRNFTRGAANAETASSAPKPSTSRVPMRRSTAAPEHDQRRVNLAAREDYLVSNSMFKVPSESVNSGRVRYQTDIERE